MKRFTVIDVEAYLAKNIEHIDLIIEQVVFLLPKSYFYTPEINQSEFLAKRQELADCRKKLQFSAYRNDKSLHGRYKRLLVEYEKALLELSINKRSQLQEELLAETLEIKCACMLSLIQEYELLKHLREFR
ncbi:hypothetical protein [Streptococcus cuniculi]|uniref:Uncharacterized protein n=1 Tax=Streptococcus cuniculi TaxID=1432788 RepID=A0A4Y9JDB0_9STRE|nr:hypothetical protein [Streptococcus cuniculi]MBF0777870.1 hypothetical protein [Streptococcus cuniculi]TFU98168.1 hypothetical protein E4T82_03925 [Streptococcus cuniculi]